MRKILDYGAGKGPYIAVVFAGALWGTNGFFIKNLCALGIDNDFVISFLRFAFASAFMGAIVLVKEGRLCCQ